jgi:hypothetical protein
MVKLYHLIRAITVPQSVQTQASNAIKITHIRNFSGPLKETRSPPM